MLVAELTRPRRFDLRDGPSLPDPSPGEIQVAVKAVGICGSDLHYFSEGGIGDARCLYPMVLGHEPAGVVVKTGAGVSGWSAGDRAILEPAIYCYHCELCMTGHHNVCANIRFMSMPADPGFFRERVNLPASNLLALPNSLSEAQGALVEPLAVIVHSLQLAAPRPGETAVVFGAGPIGLLTIGMLRLSGVGRIWSVEPVAARRELARAMGADATIDPSASDPVHEILQDTAKRGVDIAIDCAAQGDTINQCVYAARNAGRVIVTGIPAQDHINLAFHVVRRKELAFLSVRRSNHDSETALRLLESDPKRFSELLTHDRPVSDIQSAFELCESRADGVGKMTIHF
ncbi:MAG TPA: alcohol dehydrogenase catalytic domain-containing protein [Bryobacteraceae bacterium]|nr:alcohol dehydrogenase catalytic domain-containing protein [Bryobacteraceae bacterium]